MSRYVAARWSELACWSLTPAIGPETPSPLITQLVPCETVVMPYCGACGRGVGLRRRRTLKRLARPEPLVGELLRADAAARDRADTKAPPGVRIARLETTAEIERALSEGSATTHILLGLLAALERDAESSP